jgi:PAS domain S-box-containing protein
MIFGPGVVVVEFTFEAEHKGPFAGHAATGARVKVPGCGVYEYDSAKQQITAARIYFDVGTLLQIIADSLVDDRQKAEEALQSNERNLSLITNVIPTFIHVLRSDGSVLYVNQAVLGYTGLTLEDVRKEDYRARVFHPEDVERLREERREALTRAVPFENEQRVLGKDGRYRWFLVRYNPLLDDQGRIDRWYVAAFDIEDRKRAEQALAVSERELRSIINTIPTFAWCARPDGYGDFLNQRWLDYTGMTAEQAAGWRWGEAIHPDDRKGLVEYWQSCLASGVPGETEARMRRFDGAYRWFLFRANPLRDESGKIVKWYGTNIDIEDRKRREEALHASELSWRQIVDSIPGLVATTSAMGEVEFLNRQTLEYFGKTNEELKNWSLIGAVHPDDLSRVIEARMESIEAERIYEVEHRCRRADGVYRWFQVRGVPVRDTKGTVTSWYLLLTDIEERKQAEDRLRESGAYLAEAQKLSQTGSWAWNPATGEIRYWSEECYRVLGFDPLGPPPRFDAFFQRLHPDDQAASRERFETAVRDKADFELDYRIVHPDRGIRDIQAIGHAVLTRSGDLVEFVGTVIDITERKRAEEELRQLVDLVPQIIVVLGPDGQWIHANRVAREYTGLAPDDYRSLDLIRTVIHSDDAERMRTARARGLSSNAPFEIDARLRGRDGTYRWFLLRYNPLVEHGSVRRWYATATEIESRKQEEERVRKENVRLEERTRIAQELHDTLLQSFLSASMQLGVALEGVAPDSLIKPRLDRVLQITRQGIEEGRKAIRGLRSSDPHISDLVLALSRIQEELDVQPDIDFRVTVAGRQKPLPPETQHEIYRIGRESLVNAFCHSGAKRVELKLEYSDSELRMRIRDNGCGIDPEVLEKGRDGHWGLAGMQERATRIGGVLKILSSPTAGTEVQLSIPSGIALEPSLPSQLGIAKKMS